MRAWPLVLVALIGLVAWLAADPGLPGHQAPIVFQTDRAGNWDLYLMPADGRAPIPLTRHPAEDWLPRWWPAVPGQGPRLTFVSNREGGWHIYLLDLEAALRASARGREGGITRLTTATEDNWDPAPSPDGRFLAFSALDGDNREVYLLDVASGTLRNLSNHPAEDWLPAWPPAAAGAPACGRSLVFVSDRDGNMELYRLDLETGEQTNLTNHPADDWVPAWLSCSETGGTVAFQSNRDGNWEIYVLGLASGEQRNLTRHPADDWDPAWAPGGRIVFMTLRDGNREVYLMDAADGGHLRRLTWHPAADKNPAWAPEFAQPTPRR